MHAAANELPSLQVYGPDGLGKTAMGGHPRRHSRHALSSTLSLAGQWVPSPATLAPLLNTFLTHAYLQCSLYGLGMHLVGCHPARDRSRQNDACQGHCLHGL